MFVYRGNCPVVNGDKHPARARPDGQGNCVERTAPRSHNAVHVSGRAGLICQLVASGESECIRNSTPFAFIYFSKQFNAIHECATQGKL